MKFTGKGTSKKPALIDISQFSGGTTGIHALACMHETVLPYTIEWMGRDTHGYSAMFDFVKSFPNLFNVSCGQVKEWKKRKL